MNHQWNPAEFFATNGDPAFQTGYAVVLLNQPIHDESLFEYLWNNAAFRVAVDGGGNQWHRLYTKISSLKLPDVACGDFDSLNADVMKLFRESSTVEVTKTPDQDATDFTKALGIIASKIKIDSKFPKMSTVLAICEPSGRFDQILANIETMFTCSNTLPTQNLYLMGSTNITWLLKPGVVHHIKMSDLRKITKTKMYCSLIPIGGESTVTTTGLKWNLNNDLLKFGVLVSTSNELAADADVVTVLTSHPIVWSVEVYRDK